MAAGESFGTDHGCIRAHCTLFDRPRRKHFYIAWTQAGDLMSQPLCTAVTNTDLTSCVDAYTSRLGKPWHPTDELISFIGVFESGVFNGTFRHMPVREGMILRVYDNGRGNPTVGMGHLVLPQDHLRPGDSITLERGREFARADLAVAANAINRRVMVPLYQYEFDSLVSITLNVGAGDGIGHLVEKINTGHYEEMPDFIRQYRARGIAWRRRAEAVLFGTGAYNAAH